MKRSRASKIAAAFLISTVLASFASARPQTLPQSISLTENEREILITDSAGRALRFPHPPRRIVALAPAPYVIAHLLYMFPEGRERLIGMERKGKSASDFLPLIDGTFERKSFLDPNPGPEQIAALKPDLVLMRGTNVEAKALAALNIPVVYLSLETPERYERDLANIGALLGNRTRADELTGFFRNRLGRVLKTTAPVAAADRPRVLLAMAVARGGKVAVEVPALRWIQTIQVQSAGGSPAWEEAADKTGGWTVINLEQIASWNPDVIVLVVWYSMDPNRTIADFKADSRWAALKAVRSGRIYAFPSDLYGWDTPDPRWILGLTWLATKIHPNLFRDIDMDAEIDGFYGFLYGMDKAAVDAKIRTAIRTPMR